MYEVRKTEGQGMSLSHIGQGIRPTVTFSVVNVETGRTVWSDSYFSDVPPRTISGYRLQAALACKRLEQYVDHTGKRWEDEQDAKAACSKRDRRIAYLETHIPKLAAELKQLEEERRKANDDGVSGQDRDSYSDEQDRDSYTVED